MLFDNSDEKPAKNHLRADRQREQRPRDAPSSLADGLACKYDAWNRLVEVKDGATVVGEYEFDGLGRRVVRRFDADSPASPDGLDTYVHYFYDGHQVVEERETAVASTAAESINPRYQYVWSAAYTDAHP